MDPVTPVQPGSAVSFDDLVPPSLSADPHAAVKFSDLMEAPPASEAAAGVEAVAPTSSASMGDHILGGLQGLSTELQNTWRTVSEALAGNGAKLKASDLMLMQMGITTMSVQYEMISKAVSRSTQNIDQLVKLQ